MALAAAEVGRARPPSGVVGVRICTVIYATVCAASAPC